MKLSESQLQTLRRTANSIEAFEGKSIRTLDSLYRLGFITYYKRWVCRTCGDHGCREHKSGRWRAWADLTPDGRRRLGEEWMGECLLDIDGIEECIRQQVDAMGLENLSVPVFAVPRDGWRGTVQTQQGRGHPATMFVGDNCVGVVYLRVYIDHEPSCYAQIEHYGTMFLPVVFINGKQVFTPSTSKDCKMVDVTRANIEQWWRWLWRRIAEEQPR